MYGVENEVMGLFVVFARQAPATLKGNQQPWAGRVKQSRAKTSKKRKKNKNKKEDIAHNNQRKLNSTYYVHVRDSEEPRRLRT